MRKLCSILLVLSLLFSLTVTASAASSKISSESNTIELSDGSYLVSEDLPNGDAKFSVISNGNIIAESYLSRNTVRITNTDTRSTEGVQVQPVMVTVPQSITKNNSLNRSGYIPSGFTKRGTITYNFYGGMYYVVGTRSLNVYYDQNYYYGSRYNVNGVYQNIAGFASTLAALLALPAGIAASVAAKILGSLSIATGVTSIIIPDHYVRCNETEITWLSQIADIPDMYATFTGSQFVLTEEGYSSATYYSGDYWPLSSYTNHNSDFAVKLYWEVLGQDVLEIVSWS